jgi:hypothetical protein
VTCGGAFDSSIGHYVDNVIAFATIAAKRRALRRSASWSRGEGSTPWEDGA